MFIIILSFFKFINYMIAIRKLLTQKHNLRFGLMFSNRKLNYYELLGIDKNSAPAQIKKRYYILAQQYHPDKNPNATEMFKQIAIAYNTLKDPQKKRQYDSQQNINTQSQYRQPNPNYKNYSYGYKSYQTQQDEYRNWKQNNAYQYYNPYSKSNHYTGPFQQAYNNFKAENKTQQQRSSSKHNSNKEQEDQYYNKYNKYQRGYMNNPSDYAQSLRRGIILLIVLVSIFTTAEIIIRIYQFNSYYRRTSYYERLDPRDSLINEYQ